MNYLAGIRVDKEHRVISRIQADEGDTKNQIAITSKAKTRLKDRDLHLENILSDTSSHLTRKIIPN